jgi:exonuclease SbcC
MRILTVRFRNLNSLAGEWLVDFTHPNYASNGIFAITGPTGAGKTTILDAICLGLYGRTPRLDKVTKSSNEIMSRQTGECFAEVAFETQKGRYRCQWSQRRSRKKPDGELQPARHEVSDLESGKVLESRIIQVGEFIEDATGMDFGRFTRSMLLAQGEFAVFLKASPDERGPILEQITGTEIYSQISIKVHERRAEEREKLELLQAQLKVIQVLSEDEERELQTGLKERLTLEEELGTKLEDLRKAVLWREALAKLENDIVELDKQGQDFERRQRAFTPEAEKLEKCRKALSLEGDYRTALALRTLQNTEVKELEEATFALPEKEKVGADALRTKQTAETALNDARSQQSAEADIIKKVREQDARLNEQKKQLEEKDKEQEKADRQSKEYKLSIENAAQALKAAQIYLEDIIDYQATHATDAALSTNLTVIAREFTALSEMEARHLAACEVVAKAARGKESVLAESKKREEAHEQSRRKFEIGQNEQRRLAAELVAILRGREISEWRQENNTFKDRERLLIQTGATIERIDGANQLLKNLKLGLGTLRTSQEKLAGELELMASKKALLEKDIGTLETQVLLLSRIRNLEEQRKQLEDGKPCPLCGATEHPYAWGNIPELNSEDTALKNARTEFKNTSDELSGLEAQQARVAVEILHMEKEIADTKAARDADEKACTDALAQLTVEAAPEARAGKVREEQAGVQVKLAETSKIITMADDIGKKEKVAQNTLEKLRAQFDLSGKAVQDIRLNLETSGLEYLQLSRDRDSLEEETNKLRAAILKDIEPFGVKQIPSDHDSVVQGLTTRHNLWQKKLEEKAAREKTIYDQEAGIEKNHALLKSLENEMAARREERDNLMRLYGSESASRRESFGNKSPDQEEKRLADAVYHTGQAFEKAREEYGKVDREIGALKEKMEVLTAKTRKRAQELEQADQKLTVRITQAGFTDEEDYLSACLSEEERESLNSREKSLIKEKTELDTRRKDKTTTLAAEREKHLTEQPLEMLKESVSTCDSDLKNVRLDIGGITKTLTENKKLKEKQLDIIKIIDAQKNECARWDDLHQLIGSADGKKFRNFAQGLTFEMMIAQANRQLRKMTDRYLLIRDASQPLELNVIDNYQAGEIRSTKNLSGGESFIVSLALALGLSQMASRNVRLDSLFLDEGFGSLDEDALETALETLAGLQQTGKLIGIISHVPALKERIGAQIQVIPKTGGRSVISGPGVAGGTL